MELTKEERQLKEAMKILLRDGKDGKLFEAAKSRYIALKTEARISHLSHEIEDINWTGEYNRDIKIIEQLIAVI